MVEVTVMSDEEFEEYHRKKQKDSFLQELKAISGSSTKKKRGSFSVKTINPEQEQGNDKAPKTSKPNGVIEETLSELGEKDDSGLDEWSVFVSKMDEERYSPINDAVESDITSFQYGDKRSGDMGNFDKIFKKESAMISELLRDVSALGTKIGKDIKKYSINKKGAGITKNYADLIAAYNGIVHNEHQLISSLTTMKTKQMDWYLKDKDKHGSQDEEEDVDSIVNRYYSKVMDGSMKQYNAAAMQQYKYDENFHYDEIEETSTLVGDAADADMPDVSDIDSSIISTGFNITQPLSGYRGRNNPEYTNIDGNAHGNIIAEQKSVEICVYKYGETLEFVALDADGCIVEGVELPSDKNPGILASMQLRPGSNYIYDRYGRKYRLFDKTTVDISDIDDMEYPFDSDEDK